jgi:hypothetical protein
MKLKCDRCKNALPTDNLYLVPEGKRDSLRCKYHARHFLRRVKNENQDCTTKN